MEAGGGEREEKNPPEHGVPTGSKMAPVAGFEPATQGLTVLCATTALHRNRCLQSPLAAERRAEYRIPGSGSRGLFTFFTSCRNRPPSRA